MVDTTWTGVVVRCNANETGTVPRSASSQSPDIILAGTEPMLDPSVLTDPANYGNAYGNSLTIGRPNYIYVRGKNFTEGDLSGNWNLFYATPNILLYPYLWEKNQLATSGGDMNPAFTIDKGEIGASEDAFTWVPDDTSNHYCMVAIANTPEHGNPVSGVNNISSLAEVMTNNGNIAQRNVQMIRGNVPSFVSKAAYSQGSEGSTVDLAIVFENIPKGSKCTVSSGTPLNGRTLSYNINPTLDNDFKYAWVGQDIPANWQTLFTYTITFGSDWSGIPDGKHPKITIRGELVQESTDRLYHLGVPADPDPETGLKRMDRSGAPVHIITVGSVSTEAPDVVRPTSK